MQKMRDLYDMKPSDLEIVIRKQKKEITRLQEKIILRYASIMARMKDLDFYDMKPSDLEKVIKIQEKEITKLQEKIKEIEQKVSDIVNQFRNKGAL